MDAVRVETTLQADGELHLTDLPCRRGDKVEAIILVLESSLPQAREVEREAARAEARELFLTLARSSTFRSTDPYLSRDELQERH